MFTYYTSVHRELCLLYTGDNIYKLVLTTNSVTGPPIGTCLGQIKKAKLSKHRNEIYFTNKIHLLKTKIADKKVYQYTK